MSWLESETVLKRVGDKTQGIGEEWDVQFLSWHLSCRQYSSLMDKEMRVSRELVSSQRASSFVFMTHAKTPFVGPHHSTQTMQLVSCALQHNP